MSSALLGSCKASPGCVLSRPRISKYAGSLRPCHARFSRARSTATSLRERLDALALRLRRRLAGSLGVRGRRRRQLGLLALVLLVFAGDRVLELAHSAAE